MSILLRLPTTSHIDYQRWYMRLLCLLLVFRRSTRTQQQTPAVSCRLLPSLNVYNPTKLTPQPPSTAMVLVPYLAKVVTSFAVGTIISLAFIEARAPNDVTISAVGKYVGLPPPPPIPHPPTPTAHRPPPTPPTAYHSSPTADRRPSTAHDQPTAGHPTLPPHTHKHAGMTAPPSAPTTGSGH